MFIDDIINRESFTLEDIVYLLSISDKLHIERLKNHAYGIMKQYTGEKVYLRGLIEFSNVCINDCYYCGIRKSNHNVKRYTLENDEIIDTAKWCANQGFGSLVLQSGERNDEQFIEFVENTVRKIKEFTKSDILPNGLGVTLCVGEQSRETYLRFFNAGAHRYLLRIETSNPDLFSKIHPDFQIFNRRIIALKSLKEVGFQVGTGVMIGIPGQTINDLANDVLFFKEMDIDMLGMGPYIIHSETPMNAYYDDYSERKREIYKLSLKMIAVSRIILKDINIASTTALQAMYPMGREAGLMFGANVIMPMLTPTHVRSEYQLYNGKPCIDEFTSDCFECVQQRIESTGRTVAKDEYGDSRHYFNKKFS
ncbi:MAG: [FeFe] hydrogenase H-cluster radical SAM maturase HydE [Ignavibacteriae bacterium]|nr:[FeFe] hydrogenase H-cluster radical SAM maturase HydE [Ignavibacteriota bacterium]